MFTPFLEACVGMPDAELDERLRQNELRLRQLQAERSALIAVTEQLGSLPDGHRSMAGYLRATVNNGQGTIARDRKLARMLAEHPVVGDALWSGRITVDQAVEIARIDANRRIRHLLHLVVEVLVERAEHRSHREFADDVDQVVAELDRDGAFDDLKDSIEGRNATVSVVGGELVVTAVGGDPVAAEQAMAVFESFVEGEYRADVAARREQYGDDAGSHELPRTPGQRRFDALIAILAAAAASPEGRALPEPTVNLIVDADKAHEVLAHAGVLLPSGHAAQLDDDGSIANERELLGDLEAELAADPESFLDRRCETSTGAKLHASVVLRALLTAKVRRVVMDSRGVVIDYGTSQRLFTGLARQAAMLLIKRCEHPGCDLPARWSEVDHNIEWYAGGRTDQSNRNIECDGHNVFKHRERWRTRRDARGRAYSIRPDGTIVLPVGERPPDLSEDEARELVLARLFGVDTVRQLSA